jgi:protein-tyrosine phosphatase
VADANPTTDGSPPGPSILVVCTANQCRSPMAEALLRRRLPDADIRSSAAVGRSGVPASDGAIRSMANFGLDISAHRSHAIDDDEVTDAGLVLAMARMHVREIVVRVPSSLSKTFTLKELVRLAERVGPRPAGVRLGGWLAGLRPGRRSSDLLGDDAADDVADPIGQRQARYDACAVELDDLVDRLCRLAFPPASPTSPGVGVR